MAPMASCAVYRRADSKGHCAAAARARRHSHCGATATAAGEQQTGAQTGAQTPPPGSVAAACVDRAARAPRFSFAAAPPPSLNLKRVRSFGSFGNLSAAAPRDENGESSPEATTPPEPMTPPTESRLDAMLMDGWESAKAQGLFNYDVGNVETRVIPGQLSIIAQLNEGRATQKRPTEIAVDSVAQEFDPNKFHFGKAAMAEALFAFESAPSQSPESLVEGARPVGMAPNLVLINVSPIERGHVLLVPRVSARLPQLLARDTLALALRLAAESDNAYFRVGFNSLGAYASINHLHFQAYYLGAPFPIERAPTEPVALQVPLAGARLRLSRTRGYPVRALVLETVCSDEHLCAAATAACLYLQSANQPYNLLICDRGARLIIMPNQFSTRLTRGQVPENALATGVNPAVFECSGHLLYKHRADYETATQRSAWALLKLASLDAAAFRQLEVAVAAAINEALQV